jgi:hypothetical protein
MALEDVPLEDAGGDYYDRKFSGRVRDIRKSGAASTRKSRSGANGWAAGGGVVAVLVVIRIIIAIAVGVSGSSSSSYNNYNSYQTPTTPATAPIDWNNNIQVEPQPWQVQPRAVPDFQQDERLLPPIPPPDFGPEPPPLVGPDKDD